MYINYISGSKSGEKHIPKIYLYYLSYNNLYSEKSLRNKY